MTTTEIDIPTLKLFDGRQYSVSENTDLAGGASASILIENPEGSGTEAYIYLMRITHEVETDVALYTDVSDISGGSSEVIQGDNIGNSTPSNLSSTANASYTTSNEHFRIVYTGSGEHDTLDSTALILQEGHNLVIELTNNGSSNSQIGIRASWVEKPN